MFAPEPGRGSLQAAGGRRLQMISRLGFPVGSRRGLSLWGPSGLQDSSKRCRVRARPAELAAHPRRPELPGPAPGSSQGSRAPLSKAAAPPIPRAPGGDCACTGPWSPLFRKSLPSGPERHSWVFLLGTTRTSLREVGGRSASRHHVPVPCATSVLGSVCVSAPNISPHPPSQAFLFLFNMRLICLC